MSGLVERITAVVDDHWPSGGGNFCEGCDWGDWKPDAPRTWAAHVAEQVAAELQLTEERHWVSNRHGVLHHAIVGWVAVEDHQP